VTPSIKFQLALSHKFFANFNSLQKFEEKQIHILRSFIHIFKINASRIILSPEGVKEIYSIQSEQVSGHVK
jgi:hypothetical protein